MSPSYQVRDLIETLESRYLVLRILGTGGMCTVYLVRDEAIRRVFVCKMLHPRNARSREERQRFFQEASALAQLRNEHIVSCYRRAESKRGEHFFLLDYVEGQSVRDLIDRDGALHPPVAVSIADKVLDALEHAHQMSVVHRDVKPENVLFIWERKSAMLIDFGVMKFLDAAAAPITDPSASPGTPAYAAPEQLAKPPTASRETDVHAVGVLLYEMVTGEHPFARGQRSVSEILEAIRTATPPRLASFGFPRELDEIVARALSKDPSLRPTVRQFREALRRVMASLRAPEHASVLRDLIVTTDRALTDTRITDDLAKISEESLARHVPNSVPGDLPLPAPVRADPDTVPVALGVLRDMRRAHPEAVAPWAPIAAAVRASISGSVDGVWRSIRATVSASHGPVLYAVALVAGAFIAIAVTGRMPGKAPAAPVAAAAPLVSIVPAAAPTAPAATSSVAPAPSLTVTSTPVATSTAAKQATASAPDAGARSVAARPRATPRRPTAGQLDESDLGSVAEPNAPPPPIAGESLLTGH